MLSATGFAGNECAPELDDAALDAIVSTASVSPETEIAFQFSAGNVVSDAGAGATAPADILFILDPDLGTRINGATPAGATLSLNDQGTTDVADDLWEFSWTPDATQVGAFRLFIIATDDGGTDNIPLSDVYAFDLTIDSSPRVDLNGDNVDGVDFGPVTFTEGDSSVDIVDSDNLSIPFVSGNMVSSATVIIDSPQAGDVESLGITGGVLDVDTSTPGQLVITVAGGGLADKSVFETALRTLTYTNTSDDPIAMQTISVTINDGTSESDAAVATVNITPTNDGPTLRQIESPVDAMVGVEYALDLVAEDPDGGDLLVFQLQVSPAGAVITPNPTGSAGLNTIQVARDPSDGLFHAQIVWTPTLSQSGTNNPAVFNVSVTDTGGAANDEVYEVAIENQNPVANDDPTAGNDPFDVSEDVRLTLVGNILANDTDPDGDTPVVHSVLVDGAAVPDATNFTTANGALVTIATNGDMHYDPSGLYRSLAVGDSDTDTFQYSINDGKGGVSGEATVTITINGENDTPVANNVSTNAIEDGSTVDGNFDGEDPDDGETATLIYAISSQPSEGSVQNNDDGTFTFDPEDDFQDLAEGITRDVTFNYTATDAQTVVSNEAIATITVTGVNDAPVIDLSNDTGVPSVLPTGNLQAGSTNIINLELDLNSPDLNVSRLNLLDLKLFTNDPDGDDVTYDMELGIITAFREANEPDLTDGVLSWVPTLADLGQGYVIQITGDDQPVGGNAMPLNSFDILIDVVETDPPQVASVTSSIEVALEDSVVTILFDEEMGPSAFVATNYSFVAIDGGAVNEMVSVSSATALAGNAGVVLHLNDAAVNGIAAPLAGGTQLKLTLEPPITGLDGNALGGVVEFQIDLII